MLLPRIINPLTIHFLNIALQNVELLLNSPTESARRSDFIYGNGVTLDDIISFMVNSDYIETDADEGIYFLTQYAYSLIEDGTLESHMRFKLGLDEPSEDEEEDYEYEIQDFKDTLKIKEKSKQVRRVAALSFLLFLVVSFILNQNSSKPVLQETEIKIDQETLDKIQHISDSLINSELPNKVPH